VDVRALLRLSGAIDELGRRTGVIANWFVLFAASVCAFDALFRYSLSSIYWLNTHLSSTGGGLTWLIDLYRTNSNSLRDAQLVLFAGMVMLGAAWTLKVNEHVRVDLFYGWASDRTRIWIDLLGTILFLMPMCVLLIYFSWPWFLDSWVGDELSQNAGGLPRWPAKLFVPLGFGLILLQGISELIKCWAALTTDFRREHGYEKPVQ
jgi:TRAP-type mannitol/chloroaromatic compound transport system permease small subunit